MTPIIPLPLLPPTNPIPQSFLKQFMATEIPITAAEILDTMAATFRDRQKTYGTNYKMVAPMVQVLFPKGVPPELVISDKWHLFESVLVKLSRFAMSSLTHQDSAHDIGVYAAMLEALIIEEKANEN